MNTQTHHWPKYVLIALLALCLFFFHGNSHADERFASYDIAGEPQTADTAATNTDSDKDTTTTATNTDNPSDLTANYAIINPSNVLNTGEVQYFNRRLDNLYKQHHIHTTVLLINKKDKQALADAQQFVKQWQTKDTTHQELLITIFFDNVDNDLTQNTIFAHNLEHILPKETRHRIVRDMSHYTDSQYYFDGIDWALDGIIELLENGSLGLSYEQITDKAEYHFGQLLGFLMMWTLAAIVIILFTSQYINAYLAKWLGHKNSYWLSVLIILVLFAGIGYHGWLKMGWLGVLVGVPLVWLACSKLTSKPLLILNKEELEEISRRRVGGGGSDYGDSGDSGSSYSGGGGDFGGGGAGDSW